MGDDRHIQPLAPDLELVDRRGPEGVAGGEHDRSSEALVIGGQLGDRGGLADAVDADNHDHEGNAALQDFDLAIAGRQFEQADHVAAKVILRELRDR